MNHGDTETRRRGERKFEHRGTEKMRGRVLVIFFFLFAHLSLSLSLSLSYTLLLIFSVSLCKILHSLS